MMRFLFLTLLPLLLTSLPVNWEDTGSLDEKPEPEFGYTVRVKIINDPTSKLILEAQRKTGLMLRIYESAKPVRKLLYQSENLYDLRNFEWEKSKVIDASYFDQNSKIQVVVYAKDGEVVRELAYSSAVKPYSGKSIESDAGKTIKMICFDRFIEEEGNNCGQLNLMAKEKKSKSKKRVRFDIPDANSWNDFTAFPKDDQPDPLLPSLDDLVGRREARFIKKYKPATPSFFSASHLNDYQHNGEYYQYSDLVPYQDYSISSDRKSTRSPLNLEPLPGSESVGFQPASETTHFNLNPGSHDQDFDLSQLPDFDPSYNEPIVNIDHFLNTPTTSTESGSQVLVDNPSHHDEEARLLDELAPDVPNDFLLHEPQLKPLQQHHEPDNHDLNQLLEEDYENEFPFYKHNASPNDEDDLASLLKEHHENFY